MTSDVEHLTYVPNGLLYTFFGRLFFSPLPTLIGLLLFISVVSSSSYFGYQPHQMPYLLHTINNRVCKCYQPIQVV